MFRKKLIEYGVIEIKNGCFYAISGKKGQALAKNYNLDICKNELYLHIISKNPNDPLKVNYVNTRNGLKFEAYIKVDTNA